MPPERHPIDLDPSPASPAETVVEFGPDKPPARSRRWNAVDLGRSLAADRRLVPLTAGLAAVALFASLVSEWQVTTVDAATFGGDGEVGNRPVPSDITDLGALGGAFLVGLFPLVAALVLTLFGPTAGRRWVRLAGLSVGGTMIGLIFALAVSLDDQSRVVPYLYTMSMDSGLVDISYGRGLWCALVGVGLATLALYLATSSDVWTWRRPTNHDDEQQPLEEPLELTVGPAKPFTLLSDERDKGISG